MSVELIKKQFENIGARLVVHDRPRTRWGAQDYDLNIRTDRHGEHYALGIWDRNVPYFKILQADKNQRHLLMLARGDRLLCGHDERHWFVATIDAPVSTILGARRALLPRELRDVPRAITPRILNTRHNSVFLRQGEWFFVPVGIERFKYLTIIEKNNLILRNEPLIRNRRSKAHIVSEVIRFGGQRVVLYDGHEYSLLDWDKLRAERPHARGNEVMKNPEVYARGSVRHPDHATLILPGWHRVYPNREGSSLNVSFYD